MTALAFVDVSKRYDSLDALRQTSVEVGYGDWVVITGQNGAGKTTLLQLASGLQDPSSGFVTVDGARAGSEHARRFLSYLSDSPAFFSDLSVNDHIDYLAGLFRDRNVANRATSMLTRFGLASRINDRPDTFSRGMKQKTAVALSLARPAKLLLLDEPTRGLDEEGAAELLGLLRERNQEGTTVVTVTHEPERFRGTAVVELRVADGVVHAA